MADYDFTGKDEPAVLGSYNSYKGKRTTAARKLELQSKDYSAITSASINDCLKTCERIVEILAAQANWLLANKHAKGKDFIDETTAWVEEVIMYADLCNTVSRSFPGDTAEQEALGKAEEMTPRYFKSCHEISAG